MNNVNYTITIQYDKSFVAGDLIEWHNTIFAVDYVDVEEDIAVLRVMDEPFLFASYEHILSKISDDGYTATMELPARQEPEC